MVEHLKNLGYGAILFTVIIALSVAINLFLTYIGTQNAIYLIGAILFLTISYFYGSLARLILTDRNKE